MSRILEVTKYLAVVPAFITFWGAVVNAVLFWEELVSMIELVKKVLTEENISKFDAMWADYEKRMGFTND